MPSREPPAAVPHCSSNGDAAAALTAMWGAQLGNPAAAPPPAAAATTNWRTPGADAGGLSAGSNGFSAPQPVPQADAAAVAAALAAAAAANPLEAEGAIRPRPPSDGGNWRVKFLHKVGVAEQRNDGGANNRLDATESIFEEANPWAPAAPDLPTTAAGAPPPPALAAAAAAAAQKENSPGSKAQAGEDVVVVQKKTQARSSDDIRLGYIKKLEHSRAFIPQLSRPKTAQTVREQNGGGEGWARPSRKGLRGDRLY
jgi:hypothetical protein